MNGCLCYGWFGALIQILAIIGLASIPLWIGFFLSFSKRVDSKRI